MKDLIFAAALFSAPAFAGHSDHHVFMCKVTSFDKTMVKGHCDPSKPKKAMIIPREWIAEDENLRVNQPVKFILNHEQFDKWMAMNQPSKKGR